MDKFHSLLLFRKKKSLILDKMTLRNASKFVIFLEYFMLWYFNFPTNECPFDGKIKIAQNKKCSLCPLQRSLKKNSLKKFLNICSTFWYNLLTLSLSNRKLLIIGFFHEKIQKMNVKNHVDQHKRLGVQFSTPERNSLSH